MPQRTPRPFRLAEALFLVAAAAVGLAWCRFLFSAQLSVQEVEWRAVWEGLASHGPARPSFLEAWVFLGREGSQLPSALLLPMTLAALALWCLGPRPTRRDLWSRPGFLAPVAVAFAVGWQLLSFVILTALESSASTGQPDPWAAATRLAALASYCVVKSNAGGAVALVWLVVAAVGRWHPERSWLDRAGRGLGLAWVSLSVVVSPTVLFG